MWWLSLVLLATGLCQYIYKIYTGPWILFGNHCQRVALIIQYRQFEYIHVGIAHTFDELLTAKCKCLRASDTWTVDTFRTGATTCEASSWIVPDVPNSENRFFTNSDRYKRERAVYTGCLSGLNGQQKFLTPGRRLTKKNCAFKTC